MSRSYPISAKGPPRLQDEVKLVPLSAWGKAYTPAPGKVDPTIDMKKSVRDHVNGLSTEAHFGLLAKLMKDNPPSPADAPMVAKMARLGIVPGQKFDAGGLGAEAAVTHSLLIGPHEAPFALSSHGPSQPSGRGSAERERSSSGRGCRLRL